MAPLGTDQAQPGSARSGHERLDGGRAVTRPTGPRPAEPARLLGPTLLDCADSELSGVLQVLGDPGGVIFFAHGQITAITTPGAPGPERLLTATGRIPPPGQGKPSPEGGSQGPEGHLRQGPGPGPGPSPARTSGSGPQDDPWPADGPGPSPQHGEGPGPVRVPGARSQDGSGPADGSGPSPEPGAGAEPGVSAGPGISPAQRSIAGSGSWVASSQEEGGWRSGYTGPGSALAPGPGNGHRPANGSGPGLGTVTVIGTGELEAVLRLALADALFAIAAGSIDGYHLANPPGGTRLALPGGVPAGELLAEAARRLEVLDTLPSPISPDRDLVVYVQGGPSSGVVPGPGQREILALANGRRTPRDIAFALGRGVYAVTLEVDRMRGAGLVLIDPGTVRVPPYLGLAGAAGDPYPPPAPGQGGLPRRRRGSTATPAPPPGPAQPDRNALMRLLRAGVGIRRQTRD